MLSISSHVRMRTCFIETGLLASTGIFCQDCKSPEHLQPFHRQLWDAGDRKLSGCVKASIRNITIKAFSAWRQDLPGLFH